MIYLNKIRSRIINEYSVPHHYKKREESLNAFNQKILDSIIDDDQEQFMELITTNISNDSDPNQTFHLTNYKLPFILGQFPSYASLCAYFGSEKCFFTLSMLSPGGTDSESMRKLDNLKRSPIHFACCGGNLNIIRELDQANYNLDSADFEDFTPICYAAMSGNLDAFKYLWMKGAKISKENGSETVLEIACLYGQLEIVKFIFETIFPNSTDSEKRNELLEMKLCFGSSLHYACESGNDDIVEYLLSLNEMDELKVNELDFKGRTPLCVACQNGSLSCVKALIKSKKAKLSVIKTERIPLIDAAMCGHYDIVKYLVSLDSNLIHCVNKNQLDAITAAVINKHSEIVEFLIKQGALNKYDEKQLGELFKEASKTNDIKTIRILDANCQIPYHVVIHEFESCWYMSCSVKMEKNVTWGDLYMQQACLLESSELASFLLQKGVNLNNVDLSYNAKRDWCPLMDLLLQNGIQLANRMDQNIPFIVTTVKTGNLKRIKQMIAKGAVLNGDIINQYDLIDWCIKGKEDLFKFLMKFNPIIKEPILIIRKCILRCIRNIINHRKNVKSYYYIIDKILEKSSISGNEIDFKICFPYAAEWSLDILKLFAKHNLDFTHCCLNYMHMSSSKYLEVYKFLEEKGCQFDSPVQYKYFFDDHYKTLDCSPIEQLFQADLKNIDRDVIIFLLKYSSKRDILNVLNDTGNITDNLIALNYLDVLKILFQKMHRVVHPLKSKYVLKASFV